MQSFKTAQTDNHNLEDRQAIEELCELPPSAKLVAKVLEYNDTLTQSQLEEQTLLPPRTVRYALNRLEDHDLIDSRCSLVDARKRCYSLAFE